MLLDPAGTRPVAIVAGMLVALAGCAQKISYLPAGTTYGEITVSKPRVSTRERLINDRLEEDAWLKVQLEDTDNLEFGNQGVTDIRAFSGTFARAGIAADSGANALYREKQSQALVDVKKDATLRDLDHQIAVAKKQRELADLLAGTSSSTPVTSSPTAAVQPASAPRPDAAVQAQLAAVAATMDTLATRINSLTGRGTDTAPMANKASPSPIDVFRDRLSYREEVRNERIRNALDDAHDLGTNALYRFTFDTTVFPGDDTSAWAVVGVEVTLPPGGTKTLADFLGPGHITVGRFARIVNARIAEEGSEYGQQVQRECRDSTSPGCLAQLRPDTLLSLYDYAFNVPLPAYAKQTLAQVQVESSYQGKMTQRVSPAPQAQVLRAAPVAPQPSRGALQFLSKAQLEALWSKLALLGGWNGQGTVDAELVAIGTARAVTRALALKLADGFDTVEWQVGRKTWCRLAQKRLLGFRPGPEDSNTTFVDPRNPDLALITMLREQSEPDSYETSKSWEVSGTHPCTSEGFLMANWTQLAVEITKARADNVFAYAATPKETVQRISEVLARRNASEFALALQAVTGAASVDAMFSHIRANDALFHALRRQPLVVGFSGAFAPQASNDPTKFGWAFGPRYEVRYGGSELAVPVLSGFWNSTTQAAGFRHTLVQNNVSAVVSIPAAYERVRLKLTKCWSHPERKWSKGSSPADCAGGEEWVDVRLPLDERRVFRLEGQAFSTERQVTVAANSPWKYEVRVDEPATLVIRGDHLWRNTKVLLGAQEADGVQVLPDMRGILVSFKRVRPPTESGLTGREADLKVVTSEQTVLAGQVKVLEPKVANAVTQWALDGPRLVVPGGPFRVVAENRLPASYASIDLKLVNSTLAEAEPVETSDRTVDDSLASVAFAFVKEKVAKWRSGDSVRAEIGLKRLPNDPSPQVRVIEPLVFYKTDEEKVAYKAAANAGADGKRAVTLTFPPRFRVAYPVLSRTSRVQVSYSPDGKEVVTDSCEPKPGKGKEKDKETCDVALKIADAAKGKFTLGDGAEAGYPELKAAP